MCVFGYDTTLIFVPVFPDRCEVYEVLSLGCRKGDLECVKMMINKYDSDPRGLLQ